MASHSVIARWYSVACDIQFLKILFVANNSKILIFVTGKLEKYAPIHFCLSRIRELENCCHSEKNSKELEKKWQAILQLRKPIHFYLSRIRE